MTRLLIATRLRSRSLAAGDRGQGTLEYVGMIVAVAVVVAAVVAVLKGVDLGGKISDAFNSAFG
jgi:hypothetical protein